MTNFFHIGFEVISYDYSQLCTCLGHLVIDFLVANDIIPSSSLHGFRIITISCDR
jgi:hypothetical protein